MVMFQMKLMIKSPFMLSEELKWHITFLRRLDLENYGQRLSQNLGHSLEN